jgi:hypothetical protein
MRLPDFYDYRNYAICGDMSSINDKNFAENNNGIIKTKSKHVLWIAHPKVPLVIVILINI